MTTLKPYESYKTTTVPWLEALPIDWSESRLGYETWVRARLGWKGLKADEYVDSGFAFLSTPNIKRRDIDFERVNFITRERYDESPEIKLTIDDVLLAKDGSTLGTTNVVRDLPVPATVNSSIAVLTPGPRCEGRYIHYLLQSELIQSTIEMLKGGMGVPHLFQDDIRRMPIPLPPREIQTRIVDYLDCETAQIDDLIAKQERLIELLAEKRKAIITHAVTKGIDRTAPTKPSGIPWIGDIPEHWTVGPVKRFFRSLDNRRIPLSTVERTDMQGTYPYYGASGIIDYVDDFIYDEPLVLVSEDGANLLARSSAIAFVAAGKYWVNNHAHILKPVTDSVEFWAARIECEDLTRVVTGSAQPKLTIEALMNLQIAAPVIPEETRSIQEFIVKRSLSIDALLDKANSVVRVLRERRSALIAAAVTGKIDVREGVAKV